ncbi:MAG: UDP-3-O-(3-hydroxymyristoyl)glucosamine N-acyltransferase [Burkholderiaceae bacterium]|nr:UDP-3-O-(3-hydroxymyristoyl)glucosamine N-acyltransferase [Burkholderiaceae bacterium]
MRRLDSPLSLGELARLGGARLVRGDASMRLHSLASLEAAGPDDLAFLSSARLARLAQATRAGAVVVSPALAARVPPQAALLESDDAQRSFAAIARHVAPFLVPRPSAGVHPTAAIGAAVTVGRDVHVGAFATVDDGADLGDGASIEAGAHVGAGTRIGEGTRLHPRVVVEHDCVLGRHCEVFPGTVIGADGFGFVDTGTGWEKVPQLGRVVIGDAVEIGANCAIDRGALDDTVIESGCKLDNLIQVAHNVRIGAHTAIAGCVGIAGSAYIGRRCRIGGGAGILGHLEICDDVTVSAMSLVTRSIRRPGFYSGVFPLMDNADWEKAAAMVRRLPQARARRRATANNHRIDE